MRDAMRQITGRLVRIGALCDALRAVVGCASGAPYTWPAYQPDLNYHFSKDRPELKPPTKVLDDVTGVVGTVRSGWWCFRYGSNANALVTEAAWKPMLVRMNEESAYFRNVMGWPPDRRAREGTVRSISLVQV